MRVAFVGNMQSGKTTALQHFYALSVNAHRMPFCIRFADPLYKTQHLFTPDVKCRLFLQDLSDLVQKHFTPQILINTFTEQVQHIEEIYSGSLTDIYCDDVRTPEELAHVINLDFFTVFIQSSSENRQKRNPKQFVGAEHCTETHIDELASKCDVLINNNGDIFEYLQKLVIAWNHLSTGQLDIDFEEDLYVSLQNT